MSTINPFATHVQSFGPDTAIVLPQAEPAAVQPEVAAPVAALPRVVAKTLRPAPIHLSSGACIQFVKHGTHRDHPTHTIHIVDFWASEADFQSGKPGIRWDETRAWNGPHVNPAAKLLEILDSRAAAAFRPPPSGETHLSEDIVASLSDAPDTHGNLAHPSMAALKAVPA
jgi:hypothetical protein